MAHTASDTRSILAGVMPAKDELRLAKHAKADNYKLVLQEIRSKPGFEEFLLPLISHVTTSPADCDIPIFYININKYR